MYDKTAKYILTEDEGLRNYILGSLVDITINSSKIVYQHLHPLDSFADLRTVINYDAFKRGCEDLLKD